MRPTITAFECSPDGGKGLARDMPVRWALEEAGRAYDVRLRSFKALKGAACGVSDRPSLSVLSEGPRKAGCRTSGALGQRRPRTLSGGAYTGGSTRPREVQRRHGISG